MNPLVSVLIVEPSEIIVEGLSAMLTDTKRYHLLSPMHDAEALMERLPVVSPDLLIVNPTLLSSASKQLSAIAQLRPSMPVVALVYQYVASSVMEHFRYVVDVRASRSAICAVLSEALDAVANEGETVEQTENYELSERETDVLVLVAKGLSSKEIADTLHISIHTVNSHRKNITHKTGIKSVAGLAVYAMIHNLME